MRICTNSAFFTQIQPSKVPFGIDKKGMVRNRFEGAVDFNENHIPISHEEGHGIGARSIAAFCTKNGGYYEFHAENGVFTLFINRI